MSTLDNRLSSLSAYVTYHRDGILLEVVMEALSRMSGHVRLSLAELRRIHAAHRCERNMDDRMLRDLGVSREYFSALQRR
jgi:hypothetical protein